LIIDRAERRNAITEEMWELLPVLLAPLRDDGDVRLLSVRSATPGSFCAGADVVEYRDHAGDLAWGQANEQRVRRALDAIRTFPAPTVALIDGSCIGGGAGIAIACDFRIASKRSVFGIPPAKLGLVFPVEDTVALVRLVGGAVAKRLLLTGVTFDAEQAHTMGLVDTVVGLEHLDATWHAWAEELTGGAPGSVRAMKRIIALAQDGLQHGTDETRALVDAALVDPEHRKRVQAFLDRTPR
jgi:enoyl-CoA hydratase/carnithine racemase